MYPCILQEVVLKHIQDQPQSAATCTITGSTAALAATAPSTNENTFVNINSHCDGQSSTPSKEQMTTMRSQFQSTK